ncbi:MAG TPA: DEAD/DEAH box helicase [Caulobacteraceae bacterium]|jgi:superfamily II DNA/RNA helicase|nr:DEAD/DEAH box helicase [Caulobacteraceae bacterium]
MTTFADLGLSPEVVRAVTEAGYEKPSPIQEAAIPVALTGRDVLGIAQTGTGKTAAFTLPMIDRLAAGRARARMPRSLVLCPTRELADQVAQAFDKYAKNHKLTWALLIGGVSFDEQLKKLDRGVDVLIATPGRLLDHFERGKLLLTGVSIMVVDEADRMLDMGFIPDIERIFKLTPPNRQTLFFSATMPPEITRLTTQFLKDPTRIEASRPATTGENITQYIARVPVGEPKAKRMALRALVERPDVKNGIVFCNRKTEVDIVAKSLKVHGFDAAPIHGDLDQSMRMRTLEAFRKGELKFLVASDVAARGLDIPDVSHVFNFDVPHHAEDYVHRIGRTGRAGRTGQTFMIIGPNDARSLDKVLKLTKKAPEEVVLDLDWSLAEGGDERRERAGGRGRSGEGRPSSRSKSRGGEHRERPRKDHGERASMEAVAAPEIAEGARPSVPAPESAPVPAVETSARPARSRSRSRRGGSETPAEVAAPEVRAEPRREEPKREEPRREARREEPRREDRDDRSDRARGGVKQPVQRSGEERDHAVVGFGSDIPAFLQRAVPVAKDSGLESDA